MTVKTTVSFTDRHQEFVHTKIKRRMATPRKEWIEMDSSDDLFSKAKARLHAKKR